MTLIIGTPHTHNAGYYRNDDRVAGGQLSEADIQTCTHCQAIIKMQEWRENGAWCSRCSAPICLFCGHRALTFGCEPFVKKLEQELKQIGRLNQLIQDTQQRDQSVTAQPPIFTG
jgi:hypothetical protein